MKLLHVFHEINRSLGNLAEFHDFAYIRFNSDNAFKAQNVTFRGNPRKDTGIHRNPGFRSPKDIGIRYVFVGSAEGGPRKGAKTRKSGKPYDFLKYCAFS